MAERSPIYRPHAGQQVGYLAGDKAFDLFDRPCAVYDSNTGLLRDLKHNAVAGYVSLADVFVGSSWMAEELFSKPGPAPPLQASPEVLGDQAPDAPVRGVEHNKAEEVDALRLPAQTPPPLQTITTEQPVSFVSEPMLSQKAGGEELARLAANMTALASEQCARPQDASDAEKPFVPGDPESNSSSPTGEIVPPADDASARTLAPSEKSALASSRPNEPSSRDEMPPAVEALLRRLASDNDQIATLSGTHPSSPIMGETAPGLRQANDASAPMLALSEESAFASSQPDEPSSRDQEVPAVVEPPLPQPASNNDQIATLSVTHPSSHTMGETAQALQPDDDAGALMVAPTDESASDRTRPEEPRCGDEVLPAVEVLVRRLASNNDQIATLSVTHPSSQTMGETALALPPDDDAGALMLAPTDESTSDSTRPEEPRSGDEVPPAVEVLVRRLASDNDQIATLSGTHPSSHIMGETAPGLRQANDASAPMLALSEESAFASSQPDEPSSGDQEVPAVVEPLLPQPASNNDQIATLSATHPSSHTMGETAQALQPDDDAGALMVAPTDENASDRTRPEEPRCGDEVPPAVEVLVRRLASNNDQIATLPAPHPSSHTLGETALALPPDDDAGALMVAPTDESASDRTRPEEPRWGDEVPPAVEVLVRRLASDNDQIATLPAPHPSSHTLGETALALPPDDDASALMLAPTDESTSDSTHPEEPRSGDEGPLALGGLASNNDQIATLPAPHPSSRTLGEAAPTLQRAEDASAPTLAPADGSAAESSQRDETSSEDEVPVEASIRRLAEYAYSGVHPKATPSARPSSSDSNSEPASALQPDDDTSTPMLSPSDESTLEGTQPDVPRSGEGGTPAVEAFERRFAFNSRQIPTLSAPHASNHTMGETAQAPPPDDDAGALMVAPTDESASDRTRPEEPRCGDEVPHAVEVLVRRLASNNDQIATLPAPHASSHTMGETAQALPPDDDASALMLAPTDESTSDSTHPEEPRSGDEGRLALDGLASNNDQIATLPAPHPSSRTLGEAAPTLQRAEDAGAPTLAPADRSAAESSQRDETSSEDEVPVEASIRRLAEYAYSGVHPKATPSAPLSSSDNNSEPASALQPDDDTSTPMLSLSDESTLESTQPDVPRSGEGGTPAVEAFERQFASNSRQIPTLSAPHASSHTMGETARALPPDDDASALMVAPTDESTSDSTRTEGPRSGDEGPLAIEPLVRRPASNNDQIATLPAPHPSSHPMGEIAPALQLDDHAGTPVLTPSDESALESTQPDEPRSGDVEPSAVEAFERRLASVIHQTATRSVPHFSNTMGETTPALQPDDDASAPRLAPSDDSARKRALPEAALSRGVPPAVEAFMRHLAEHVNSQNDQTATLSTADTNLPTTKTFSTDFDSTDTDQILLAALRKLRKKNSR